MSSTEDTVAGNIHQFAEHQRLLALQSYKILDTPLESGYEDIVRLARLLTNKPIALVSLVDKHRQWFKAESGLGVRETPIDQSVCAYAMRTAGIFEVPDLQKDPRFVSNTLTHGDDGLRFYAGAPLITPEGFPIGSLCVLDRRPGTLTGAQRESLAALARQVMTQLELRRTISTSVAANRYRSRLMAVAGHDLKQPLQVVTMVLGALERKATDGNDAARIAVANAALRDLAAGLDRLAVDSKIGNERDLPLLQEFPIRQIFDTIAATWREHAAHKGIEVRVVDSSLAVRSDPILLATIVGNLVGNAIKYTQQGAVLIGCRRLATQVCIHVIDTGIGVPESRQASLFDAFHQEDARSEGLGLGLSIVQRTADALNLKVKIRSRVGRGTNFSVAVPRAQRLI